MNKSRRVFVFQFYLKEICKKKNQGGKNLSDKIKKFDIASIILKKGEH